MGFQLWGSNSLRRVMECAGMRESTSRNQANGSTPQRLQEAMKLRNTAAVLPPVSLPKKVQLPRLCAREHNRGYVQAMIMCSPQASASDSLDRYQSRTAHNPTGFGGRQGAPPGACTGFPLRWRLDYLQRLLFHLQVGFHVDMRCRRALMAEPQCDKRNVDAGLQQVHGCGVSKCMR